MGITSAIVLFVVIWFMTFFIVIPLRLETQDEAGQITPGTHASAPEKHHLKRKALIVTIIAFVIWMIVAGIIISGMITVRDIDMFGRMGNAH